eukprot:gene21006-27865_t
MPIVAKVLASPLADADGEPNLRLSALQLIDQLLEDQKRCSALGGVNSEALLASVLLPPMVWRAGKTAAAVRFAAVTALSTLMRRALVPDDTLMSFVSNGTLLPLIHQSLDEDWYVDMRLAGYVDMRLAGCGVMQQLLLAAGSKFTAEQRRAVYPELLKRLDDSSNQIRIAVCSTLVAFCTTMSPSYCDTNSGYLAQGVVIHMDDSDAGVQEAACKVLEALAAVKSKAVATEPEDWGGGTKYAGKHSTEPIRVIVIMAWSYGGRQGSLGRQGERGQSQLPRWKGLLNASLHGHVEVVEALWGAKENAARADCQDGRVLVMSILVGHEHNPSISEVGFCHVLLDAQEARASSRTPNVNCGWARTGHSTLAVGFGRVLLGAQESLDNHHMTMQDGQCQGIAISRSPRQPRAP